jgi:hypothetical protein
LVGNRAFLRTVFPDLDQSSQPVMASFSGSPADAPSRGCGSERRGASRLLVSTEISPPGDVRLRAAARPLWLPPDRGRVVCA